MSNPHWREVYIPGAAEPTMQHLCTAQVVTRQWRGAILVPGQQARWRCPGCGAEQPYRPTIVLAKEAQE